MPSLKALWPKVARSLGLSGGEADALRRLLEALVEEGRMGYEQALRACGPDEEAATEAILMAYELGAISPKAPGQACLEWDASSLGPGSQLAINPAVEKALRALSEGRGVEEALVELFSELGAPDWQAEALALVSLELAEKGRVGGSDVASSCRSHGLEGFESASVAILKGAGVISPVLASTWPSGDARYRACRFLWVLWRALSEP